MRLIYQDTDITDDVDIVSAIHHDNSGGRSDCLDIVLDNASAWFGWKPEVNDEIVIEHDGYSTGKMYLNTIMPEGETYRILASGAKYGAQRKKWKSYINYTTGDILTECSIECGMDRYLYGIESDMRYRYLMRRNESAAGFLNRLMYYEGAVLKSAYGRMNAISVQKAQEIPATAMIDVDEQRNAVSYIRHDEIKYGGLRIITPFASITATDTSVGSADVLVLTNIPATDDVTQGRWARGLLMMQNRRAEELTVKSDFNAGFSAMCRIDIASGTDMRGEWICDEVIHDFVNLRSTARMLRCIKTIE